MELNGEVRNIEQKNYTLQYHKNKKKFNISDFHLIGNVYKLVR